jgi:hypothetical protein
MHIGHCLHHHIRAINPLDDRGSKVLRNVRPFRSPPQDFFQISASFRCLILRTVFTNVARILEPLYLPPIYSLSSKEQRSAENLEYESGPETTGLLFLTYKNPSRCNPIYQWYSTFFVRVPPDIISLQLCTPKVVGT